VASVLVVDEPEVVGTVRDCLEAHGHTVRTLHDGAAAVVSVRTDPPDVVVVAAALPELDGWAVLARLKGATEAGLRSIPVLLLTADPGEQDHLRAGVEGALRCFTKPVDPETVLDAVHSVLAGGPEPAQRQAIQRRSLARLARLEGGGRGDPPPPVVRLSRLEGPRDRHTVERTVAIGGPVTGDLTDRQRELLRTLLATSTVTEAAAELGMSRANLYAGLRRIGRTLDVADVTTVLRLLRAGQLPVTPDA
jgi:DNA-binding response OmpR family regulator